MSFGGRGGRNSRGRGRGGGRGHGAAVGGEIFEMKSSDVSALMGPRGDNIKHLQATYSVKIDVPPREAQRGQFTQITISPTAKGGNLEGVFTAMNTALRNTVRHVGSANAAGAAGGFGSAAAGGMQGGFGGAGAGGWSTDIWLFRVNPQTMQVEVLLECYKGKWGPVKEQNVPNNDVGAVLEVLTNRCSGGNPIPFHECEPTADPILLSKNKRQIYHLCCPQWKDEAWNTWNAAPVAGCPGFTTTAPLIWYSENFHSWVPLSELMSLPDVDIGKFAGLQTWGSKNFVTVAQRVIEIYKSNGIHGEIANDATLIARWSAAVAPASPAASASGGGEWTQSQQGMNLVANVWDMVQAMKDFDQATFTAAIGACFPGDAGFAALANATQVFRASMP